MEANKLKAGSNPVQNLIGDGIKYFENTIEIPISKKGYEQIWKLIKEFNLDYSSVEEFVKEAFTEILELRWKMLNQFNTEKPQEKVLTYIM